MPALCKKVLNSLAALLLVWTVASLSSGCEKDDICVDGDTPLLVITFYDVADPGTEKTVNRLRVIGIGRETPISSFADRSSPDSIGLPLRVDATQTGFVLIENSEDEDGVDVGNRDTLYFDYDLLEAYVSRACGFVSQYDNLGTSLQTDASNWIDSVTVIQTTVENAASAHVSIYH